MKLNRKLSDVVRIERNGIVHELSSNNKISDLLRVLMDSKEDDSIDKYIMEININNGIKIKSAPREEFLSGKTQLEELVHPYFQNKLEENKKKEENFIETPTKKVEIELNKEDKLMLFTPHPDDEILGACGLLYKAFEEKINVKVVYMTSGKGGGNANERKNEAINGIAKIGGKQEDMIFSDLPFYSKKDRIVTDEDYDYVCNIIEENKPTSIFICADIFDPNLTHRKCYDVLMRIYKSGKYKDIKYYFYYSVWYWPKYNEYTHVINYKFDTYQKKVYAMLEHKSQLVNAFMGEDPRPFYQRAVARDGFYGKENGKAYSEIYYLLD